MLPIRIVPLINKQAVMSNLSISACYTVYNEMTKIYKSKSQTCGKVHPNSIFSSITEFQ